MDNIPSISVAVIGASGYTGQELVYWLQKHPQVQLKYATSRSYAGQKISELSGRFHGPYDIQLSTLKFSQIIKNTQAVFLALPHHESMEIAAKFRKAGLWVFDLSADFRLKSWRDYQKWYGPHTQKKLLKDAVYGMPEIYKEQIKKARLIACPGCYPTSALLGLLPLLRNKLISPKHIIVDSKSGTTGAGRKASLNLTLSEVGESLKAYAVEGHRHTPEIEQEISLALGEKAKVRFTPHLLPIRRGILSTIYCLPFRKTTNQKLKQIYQKFYQDHSFVQIVNPGEVDLLSVVDSHLTLISVHYDPNSELIVIHSAIDNLARGSATQAIECFNLALGFDRYLGLG